MILMTATTIDPCPWTSCQSTDVVVIYLKNELAQVFCRNCLATGPKAHSGSVAIELWNNRSWFDD